jgi:hypothetical protein
MLILYKHESYIHPNPENTQLIVSYVESILEKEDGLEIGNNPNQIFKTKLFEIELYNDKGEKSKRHQK